eukprot:s32_g21.t1
MAWCAIRDQLDLEEKTHEMMSQAHTQVLEMKSKLGKDHEEKCDRWLEMKRTDMHDHLVKKATQALMAMDDAVTEVLRIWVLLDLEIGLSTRLASMNLNDKPDKPLSKALYLDLLIFVIYLTSLTP